MGPLVPKTPGRNFPRFTKILQPILEIAPAATRKTSKQIIRPEEKMLEECLTPDKGMWLKHDVKNTDWDVAADPSLPLYLSGPVLAFHTGSLDLYP
jgi:hypothetical protein